MSKKRGFRLSLIFIMFFLLTSISYSLTINEIRYGLADYGTWDGEDYGEWDNGNAYGEHKVEFEADSFQAGTRCGCKVSYCERDPDDDNDCIDAFIDPLTLSNPLVILSYPQPAIFDVSTCDASYNDNHEDARENLF